VAASYRTPERLRRFGLWFQRRLPHFYGREESASSVLHAKADSSSVPMAFQSTIFKSQIGNGPARRPKGLRQPEFRRFFNRQFLNRKSAMV